MIGNDWYIAEASFL